MGDLEAPSRIVKETLKGLQTDGIDILGMPSLTPKES